MSGLPEDIAAAGSRLAPAWPITDLIAVNPLLGVQELGFEGAIDWGRRMLGLRGHLSLDQFRRLHQEGRIERADLVAALHRRIPQLQSAAPLGGGLTTPVDVLLADLLHGAAQPPAEQHPLGAAQRCDRLLGGELADAVDAEVLKWCAAFLGSAQAAWRMPGREHGFYAAWRRLAPHDPRLRRLAAGSDAVRQLPEDALSTVDWALARLAVPDRHRQRELTEQLLRTPGFSAHFRWRTEHPELLHHPGDLTDLLAVRLAYEALAVDRLCRERGLEPQALSDLMEQYDTVPAVTPPGNERALQIAASLGLEGLTQQLLDELSQVLELLPSADRAWVWLDAYEWHYRDRLLTSLSAPEPAAPLDEPSVQALFCIDTRSEGMRRQLEARAGGRWETFGVAGFFGLPITLRHLDSEAETRLLPGPLAAVATVAEKEGPGTGSALDARLRSGALAGAHRSAKAGPLAPYSMAEATGWIAGPLAAMRTLRPSAGRRQHDERPQLELEAGLTSEEQVAWAEATLRPLGLAGRFAPLVLIVGHTSIVENNAYRAALECGACGGHGGGHNARVAAAILNDAQLREELRGRGLEIPAQTLFVAAEHDTATDHVALLDLDSGSVAVAVADTQRRLRQLLDQVRQDLDEAGAELARERARLLPDAWQPRRRARDWAQVRPEWGLSRNAAFIVAPSSVVRSVDLQCRTFLHSYEWREDPDGVALTTILTAPGLVVQWINAQYYFSSVDPEVLGAGDKTLHNVLGDVGVLQGPGGDLLLGLPWQSVGYGGELFHEPMRVMFVVQAPLERLDALIADNQLLTQYVTGGWITLVAREHACEPWRVRLGAGGWELWQAAVPRPYDDRSGVQNATLANPAHAHARRTHTETE